MATDGIPMVYQTETKRIHFVYKLWVSFEQSSDKSVLL